ncbi:MAG: ABC transporter permease [Mariniphaga sp.]|nr:ABC transporter permease [Mariniphaga sp.]
MIRLFKKDLKLFLKDKRSVLLTFLLPIILISLFAFAFGGIGTRSNSSDPINLLVTDIDNSEASNKIVLALDSLKGLQLKISDLEESKELVSKGNYPGALIFHKGFEDSVMAGTTLPVELLYDKACEMEIGLLQPILMSNIMPMIGQQTVSKNIKNYLNKTFPGMDKSISEKILSDVTSEENENSNFGFDSEIKMTSIVGETEETNLGLIQAVAGTAIMMLLFSVAGMGASILEEKEKGTLSRLLYSPLNTNTILFGKMFSTFFIAILQLTLMFLFAWLVFGLNLLLNIPALILMIIATAFAVSSFGIFLAAISKTRGQAQSLSTLIILIMSAIGGSMIPLFIMPAIMKKIAVFSVNYWGIEGFYDIFWRELPLINILPKILILIGIGVSMSLISLRLFRKNVVKLV